MKEFIKPPTPPQAPASNSQEGRKKQEDLTEFFEKLFGHEIFFIEDLLLLKEKDQQRFNKLLEYEGNPNKAQISAALTRLRKKPTRIQKFAFSSKFNNLNLTALRIYSFGSPPITREMARAAFLKKFPDLEATKPRSDRTQEKPLNEEENSYYEKLRSTNQARTEIYHYFSYPNFPAHQDRDKIIRRLVRLGLIKVRSGSINFLDSATYVFTEKK